MKLVGIKIIFVMVFDLFGSCTLDVIYMNPGSKAGMTKEIVLVPVMSSWVQHLESIKNIVC